MCSTSSRSLRKYTWLGSLGITSSSKWLLSKEWNFIQLYSTFVVPILNLGQCMEMESVSTGTSYFPTCKCPPPRWQRGHPRRGSVPRPRPRSPRIPPLPGPVPRFGDYFLPPPSPIEFTGPQRVERTRSQR